MKDPFIKSAVFVLVMLFVMWVMGLNQVPADQKMLYISLSSLNVTGVVTLALMLAVIYRVVSKK